MKYALVDGKRLEATRKARGTCQCCGAPMIARCGSVRIDHWAHKSQSNCDPWWENETEWHRSWKNRFHEDWQEVAFTDPELLMHMLSTKAFLQNETATVYEADHEMRFHRLLKEWWTDEADVFLDFAEHDSDTLWYIFQSPLNDPHRHNIYLAAISKRGFVNLLSSGRFGKFTLERLEPLRQWLDDEKQRRWDKMVDESAKEFENIRRSKIDWRR